MVDAVANLLLETLRDVLIEEIKFLSEVSGQVKKVEADLRTIHALLMEADQKRGMSSSPTFRNCIDELKELAFKAENVLETYDFEVESKKQVKTLKSKLQRFMGILCECYSVHEVGNEIDDIRSGVADVTARLRSIIQGSEPGSYNSAHVQQMYLSRIRYAHEVEEHFVGMEKDIDFVVSMVKDDSPQAPSRISICGMGGLGKTTLARKIYHLFEATDQGHFDGLAWVCVTQQFHAETVLKEIFEKIDGNKHDGGLPTLVEGLHNALAKKKCLIVVDDIWETQHWDIIKPAFPTKNCKVVLTTRNEKIASREGHVHKLGLMSDDQGWELLAKIALPTNDDSTQGPESKSKLFEDIGRQMVEKCGNLPLAISVIGGILTQKRQIAEWKEVSINMDTYLRNGGEGIEDDTRVKLVLDLSFDALPYYLKPCFLYLACFPEDKAIDTERLYLLWLAEGLISSEEKGDNEALTDVAERYLAELAFRCMVQVEKDKLNTPHKKFASCRLHDLMRDLCSSKAEQEKFIKRIDDSKNRKNARPAELSIQRLAMMLQQEENDELNSNTTHKKSTTSRLHDPMRDLSSSKAEQEKLVKGIDNSKHRQDTSRVNGPSIHRLAINVEFNDSDDFLCNISVEDLKDLRSFLFLYINKSGWKAVDFQNIVNFENSKHLRILLFEGIKFIDENFLSEICTKVYLKYLSLYNCRVKELPQNVCDLSYMQTLDLRVMYGIKLKLPNNLISKMKRLKHLFLPREIEVIGGDKLRMEGPNELEILQGINSRSACIADINLKNLLSMSTIIEEDIDSLMKIVDYMSSNGCRLRRAVLDVKSCDLRNAITKMFSFALVNLCMENCEIGPGFPSYNHGMCSNLLTLTITQCKFEGDVVEALGTYPMLQNLSLLGDIFDETGKTEMRFGANSFPELRQLVLHSLMNLHKWEVEKGAMPKLLELRIWSCRNLEKLPENISFISTLQTIRCTGVSRNLINRMRGGRNAGPDYAIFSHIPSVSVR